MSQECDDCDLYCFFHQGLCCFEPVWLDCWQGWQTATQLPHHWNHWLGLEH